jgi:hypothetical protein
MRVSQRDQMGKSMGLAYNENIHEIVELCCELLTLVQNAFISESREGGSIMGYARICECASRIQTASEQRRDTIALSELEYSLGCMAVGGSCYGNKSQAPTPVSGWAEERKH